MILRGRNNTKGVNWENAHGGEASNKMFIRQLMGHTPELDGVDVDSFPDDFESGIEFVHEIWFEPHSSVGAHTHHGTEELYLVIEGEGEVTIDGETATMYPGDIAMVKDGGTHCFKAGDKKVHMYCIEAITDPENHFCVNKDGKGHIDKLRSEQK